MRVLFALTSSSREAFLPRFRRENFPEMTDIWMDPTGLSAEEWEQRLRDFRPEVLVSGWKTPSFPARLANGEDIALRYVCHLAGTVRSVVSRELVQNGILVTNWGAAVSHTIAEHAILLLLGALRSVPRWKSCIDADQFGSSVASDVLRTRSLQGKRVGLHGFGAIARNIASRLKPFGVTLSAYSQGVPLPVFQQEGVQACASLEDLFAGSDVLIECEALTPATTGCVNEAVLGLLPEDAVFVNIGRGVVVDEAALVRLAAAGKIRIALDVFEQEPLAADSPLRTLPNALLSPHCAGPTDDARPLAGDFAMENLRHYLLGQQENMQGVITLEIYDRIT